MFDRNQCDSWYRRVLGEVFPEIKDSSESGETTWNNLPKDPAKHEFQRGSLNLTKNFQVGEAMEFAGVLKGHITVQPVHESKYTEKERKLENCEDSESLPIDRFWQTDTIFAHVYVLTGRNITRLDASGAPSPYLYIEAGKTKITSDKIFKSTNNPDFYEHFAVPITVPGSDTISVQVWNSSTFSDSLIGQIDIDIEDRWQAVIQKDLTEV